jgi:putative radical SAM enzyme (TIGR03279 family)
MVKITGSKHPHIPVNTWLVSIDTHEIDDVLELRFYNDASKARCAVIEKNGTKKEIWFKAHEHVDIEIESPEYKQCENDCSFCFIKGLPNGLRKELYFRDDDYRLSFLFGNFLSLTNVTFEDIKRIGRLRLSPLYISVHVTDAKQRIQLFQNEKAGLLMKQLAALVDEKISLHCQIVVIPGLTDGDALVNTIADLSSLYPGVKSIGIIPVGTTKHLHGIPSVTTAAARDIIETVHEFHNRFRKTLNHGLVYCADEIFLRAGLPIPEMSYYDEVPQYENGVGMLRTFMNDMAMMRPKKKLKGNCLFMTGRLAFPFVTMLRDKLVKSGCVQEKNSLVVAVNNTLFGESVSVSGLLGAADFARVIAETGNRYEHIVLPPDCVNDKGEFIDGHTLNNTNVIMPSRDRREFFTWLQ